MFFRHLLFSVFLCFSVISLTSGANVLVIMGFSSPSHKNVFNPIIEGLAGKGHNVTVYSPYPFKTPIPNVTDVDLVDVREEMNKISTGFNLFAFRSAMDTFWSLHDCWDVFSPNLCENVFFKNEHLRDLRNSSGQYDVVIVDILWNECLYGFAWKLQAPMVIVSTSYIFSYTIESMGLRDLSSIHPSIRLDATEDMDFVERLKNTIANSYLHFMRDFVYFPRIDKLATEFYGEGVPSMKDIERDTSLVLVNTHFSFGYPREFPPNIVEVGAMHCKPPKPLPKDLEFLVNQSGENGFIMFSLGSVAQGSLMSEENRKIFTETFGRLKQTVLWKWESDPIPNLPPNVKLVKWLPQPDLLGHPKIKAFITHGGLLSSQEAAYHGVPLVGIPLYGDQDVNMNRAAKMGFAIKVELSTLSTATLEAAVNDILHKPRFAENAKQRSKVMKDRIIHPKDEAVWWIEYVIRHKGADHLKLASRNLTLAQYYLWDVWGFITLCVLIPLIVLAFLAKRVIMFSMSNKVKKIKDQ